MPGAEPLTSWYLWKMTKKWRDAEGIPWCERRRATHRNSYRYSVEVSQWHTIETSVRTKDQSDVNRTAPARDRRVR